MANKEILLNEKQIVVLKSLLIQEIDYLENEIKNNSGEDKNALMEEQDICKELLNELNK